MVSVSVCLSVCVCSSVRDYIPGTIRSISTKFFLHVTYGRGSVFLWWRSNMLRTPSFMDDVISAHKPTPGRRRRTAEAQLTRSPGLGYKQRVGIPVAGNGRTGLLLAVGLRGSTGGGVCGLWLPCWALQNYFHPKSVPSSGGIVYEIQHVDPF